VHFILNHVLQTLIVDRPREHKAGQHLTRDARHEQVFSVEAVAVFDEYFAHFVDRVTTEGRSVLLLPRQHASLPGDKLNHLAYCHTRRETVRVHNQIWAPAISFAKGHILSGHDESHDTFLSVARTEFIADFWHTCLPSDHFDNALLVIVRCQNHPIDVHWVRPFEALLFGAIADRGRVDHLGLSVNLSLRAILINVNISIAELFADASDSILIKSVEPFHSFGPGVGGCWQGWRAGNLLRQTAILVLL